MTTDARRRLHEVLVTRVDLLRKVEDVSRRRTEAIAAGRTDAIARLVAEREPLVRSLLESAGEVEMLAGKVAGTADADLLSLVEEASSLVDAIAAFDRVDEDAMAASGQAMRQELERLSNAGRAGRAYQGGRPNAGNRMERSA